MYEDMKTQMKPMMEMAEINKQTAEKLISLQSQYVSNFVNSSMAQMKTLSETKEPKAAFEAQVAFMKGVESSLTDVAEQEMAALTEARNMMTDLVEQSMSDMTSTPYFKELQKFMRPMDMKS